MMSRTPPPPLDTPCFSSLVMVGFAEPRSSMLTDFIPQITILRVLGSAQPKIPWEANLRGARSL